MLYDDTSFFEDDQIPAFLRDPIAAIKASMVDTVDESLRLEPEEDAAIRAAFHQTMVWLDGRWFKAERAIIKTIGRMSPEDREAYDVQRLVDAIRANKYHAKSEVDFIPDIDDYEPQMIAMANDRRDIAKLYGEYLKFSDLAAEVFDVFWRYAEIYKRVYKKYNNEV